MKLQTSTRDVAAVRADLLAVGVFEGGEVAGASGRAGKALSAAVTRAGFEGKEGKVASAAAPKGFAAGRLLLVGLGRRADRDAAETARRQAGSVLRKAREHGGLAVALLPPDARSVEHALEGLLLADYSFEKYKSSRARGGKAQGRKPEISVTVLADADAARAGKAALPRLESVARGVKLARDLGNEPGNGLTPERMAEVAKDIAKRRGRDGVRCEVMLPDRIRQLGMGAFLAVAQASQTEPRFIHLSWKPRRPSGRRVALVGKGLTFDSGGISIKPASGMEEMKMDMCGAGAVLGLFECLPDLGVEHEVHGFIAATDNMPSGSAVKPGDIVTSLSGRTIEVINTDAEGRLTLVDAITYALRSEPDVVVDLATLTGACAVALGHATGIMSNHDGLRDALWKASDATGERAWPLPLFLDYRSQIKSEFADVKNIGERYGGALTAGLFIREWVPEGLPWAHMDIAGSAWTDRELPTCPKGATGIGVRTLAHWLRHAPLPAR